MGRTCVVPGCSKKGLQGTTVSFHRFPMRHPEKLRLWLDAIGIETANLAKHHRICSEHFRPTDFYSIHSNKKKIMKDEAIPTLNLNGSPKRVMKVQSKYGTRKRPNPSKPSTSSIQNETKYNSSLKSSTRGSNISYAHLEQTPEPEEPVTYQKTSTNATSEDTNLWTMQKERLRKQMQQESLLFEQQMELLRTEMETKKQEREGRMAEHDLRVQLLHTQLEKAQLDLEEAKIRMYRFRNSSITQVKHEVIEAEEQSIPELTILSNDVQLLPMTNGIHLNENGDRHSDSNE